MFFIFLLLKSLRSTMTLKRTMIFLSLSFFFSNTVLLHAGESPQLPFTINVYASPTSNAASAAITEAVASNQAQMSTDVHVEQHATLSSYFEPLEKTLREIPPLWDYFKQECVENKWTLIGGALFLGYASLCYTIIADNFYINDADLWSRWRYEQSLTSLCALTPEKLHKELILAIQQRYLDVHNPTDNIKPLVRFIQAIELEKKRLTAYCNRAKWLKRLKIWLILPINAEKVSLAQNLLERLNFVNTLFATWASEYNWGTFQ